MCELNEDNAQAQNTVRRLEELRKQYAVASNMISAGDYHIVGLKSNGTVVAVGNNSHGECCVKEWYGIAAVSAGFGHTVGLRFDGTVVAVGYNEYGQCNVSGWRDIVAISAGNFYTVGVKKDGTVVAVGKNDYGQCNVEDWQDIIAVSAREYFTIGLTSYGTVVVASNHEKGMLNVSGWRNIVAVSASESYAVGLKKDGTAVTAGCAGGNDSELNDIISVSAGSRYILCLKADGTVKLQYGGYLTDIIAISNCGNIVGEYAVGLMQDGTVVAVGNNDYGQCNVGGWKLFESIFTLEEEIKETKINFLAELEEAQRKAEEEKSRAEEEAKRKAEKEKQNKRAELFTLKFNLERELKTIKVIFSVKRKREIKERIKSIENELNKL